MESNNSTKRPFYVVQFIEKPFPKIDEYVCVPGSWVSFCRKSHHMDVVAYPNDEDPIITKERVKRRKLLNNDWRFFMAETKHASDTYEDAELWISAKKSCIRSERTESATHRKDSQPTLDWKLRKLSQRWSLISNKEKDQFTVESNDNPRNLMHGMLKKESTFSEKKTAPKEKCLKLHEAAQSTSSDNNYEYVRPGCSRSEQSILYHDNQSANNAQIQKTEQSTPSSNQILSKILQKRQISVVPNHHQTGIVKEQPPMMIRNQSQDNFRDAETQTEKSCTDKDQRYKINILQKANVADEADVTRTKYIYNTRSNLESTLTTPQNFTSTIKSIYPKVVLEQNSIRFDALVSQMCAAMNETNKIYQELGHYIFNTACVYKELLGLIELFKASSNLASAACSSSKVIPKVPQKTENRYPEVLVIEDSSDDDKKNDHAAIETPNEGHNTSWKFVLPPEYDPDDSRWTLKHRQNRPNLIELLPPSDVYISDSALKDAERESKNCRSLAKRLLAEVFSRSALSVCSSLTETSGAGSDAVSQERPSLDQHASMVLLNFVLKYGIQRGWDTTNIQAIFSGIHSKIQQIRFKYGVIANR